MLELETTEVVEGASVTDDAFWGRRPQVSEAHVAEAANLMGAAFLGAILLALFFHPPSEAVKEPPVEAPEEKAPPVA